MKDWALNYDGFIMHYMVAGPRIKDYETQTRIPNQLALEAKLRSEIVTPKKNQRATTVKLGEAAENGCNWSFYYSYGSCFIDVSSFYSTLQKVELEAATVLCVSQDMEVRAAVWTYMSVGVYCNGQLVGEEETPVYKPIHRKEIILPLKKGRNLIIFRCENLGVRDTRNILGMQILEQREQIRVALADEAYQEQIFRTEFFLNHLKAENGRILFPETAPKDTSVCFFPDSPDFNVTSQPRIWQQADSKQEIEVPEGITTVAVRVAVKQMYFTRTLVMTERIVPIYSPSGISREDNFQQIMERIASVSSLNRGPFGFAMANILARKYLHKETEQDRALLEDTLRLIDLRVDCSDFLLCGLFRYMHYYEMEESLQTRVKEVLLRYRYWMNMEGADAMCFWSENHSLMFYSCAMEAGRFYPEDTFIRAGMNGRELYEYGRRKVVSWLEDVEEYGFEEFLSTVYMCVTFAAILNIIDFAEEEISNRASAVADKLLTMLAQQTFHGCVIAPMGRVYGEVLYPFAQGAQAIMNWIDPSVPYTYGEGWLSFLATSKYQPPKGLVEWMEKELSLEYCSGNAKIILEKNQNYCITSVQSPREEDFGRWVNNQKDPQADMDSHHYNKSLNECFHGTTCFQPGVFGYQQHMWYAALDPEAVIFVNHPGSSSEHSGLRPGYWFGNGIMPAVKQIPGMLGAVYEIPESHPIHFTHIYCPRKRFDEVVVKENWLFFRKNQSYLALWCNNPMEPYNDTIFDCELRVYGDKAAYVCICSSSKEYLTLCDFAEYAQGLKPEYDQKNHTLQINNILKVVYCACDDKTQYVD